MHPVDYSATYYVYIHACQIPVLVVSISYFDIYCSIDQYVCLARQFPNLTQ